MAREDFSPNLIASSSTVRTVASMARFEEFFPSYENLLGLDGPDAPPSLVEWFGRHKDALASLLDEVRFTDGVRSELERWLSHCDARGVNPFDPTAGELFNYLAERSPLGGGTRSPRGVLSAYGTLKRHLPGEAAQRLKDPKIRRLLDYARKLPRPEPQRATPLLLQHAQEMLAPPSPTKDELTLRAALLISHFCRVRLRRLETLTWDDVDVRADVVGVVVNGERLEIARHTDPFLDLGATLEALSDIRGDARQILEGDHRWWSERFRLSARRLAIDGWTSGGYAGRDADSETLWRVSAGISETTMAHIRNRAAVLGGLHFGLRPGELVSLRSSQLTLHPEGMVVELPISKTNRSGRRRSEKIAAVYHSDSQLCGVRALLDLCRLRGYAVRGSGLTGPGRGVLFGPAGAQRARGLSMDTDSLRRTLQKMGRAAGLSQHFVGYSLRRGAAHQMKANGEPEPKITKKLRHSNPETTASYLKRDGHEARQQILNRMMGDIGDA